MYDDYVVEWDLAFAEYLKKLASIFLKETPDFMAQYRLPPRQRSCQF